MSAARGARGGRSFVSAARGFSMYDYGRKYMENGQEPAPKQDGAKQDIADLRQDFAMIRSEMQHMREDLIERLADMEATMVKAFYSFAELNRTR